MNEAFNTELKKHNNNLYCVDKSNRNKVITDALNFICNINVNDITGNEADVASLFCRAAANIKEPDEIIRSGVIKALDNIGGMIPSNVSDNTITDKGELETLLFLHRLRLKYKDSSYSVTIDEYAQKKFEELIDNLEKICIILSFTDENDRDYFPISMLLSHIIEDDDLDEHINSLKNIQVIMLALQLFTYNSKLTDKDTLLNKLKEKNIRFIEYLLNGSRRLYGDDWKTNYEKNGVLVLYDPKKKRVLVRNIRKSYFDVPEQISSYIAEKYKIRQVEKESNTKGNAIAYFVEYDISKVFNISDMNYFSFSNGIAQESFSNKLHNFLEFIYNRKYYNIFMDNSFFTVKDSVFPVDPYSINDEYILLEGDASRSKIEATREYLTRYGLKKLCGNGIDIVNLGMLAELEAIKNVDISDMGIKDSNLSFNKLLENWLDKCDDPNKCLNKFIDVYNKQLEYIYDDVKFPDAIWDGHFFIPYAINESLLEKINFNEVLRNLDICTVTIKNFKYGEKKYSITDVLSNEDYSDYNIESLNEEIDKDSLENKEYKVFIDKEKKHLYIGTNDDTTYGIIKWKLQRLNKNALQSDIISTKTICNNDIENIYEMMKSFSGAFTEKHKIVPLRDVAIYRIANHLLLLKIDAYKVSKWLKLLRKHEILDYSFISERSEFKEENVLYVPKDRSSQQSSLFYFYNKYITSSSHREINYWYDPNIQEVNDKYYIGKQLIEKIAFVFDLMQCGNATKDTLRCYLPDETSGKGLPADKECKIMKYRTDVGDKVSILDIFKKNKCQIEIYCIYGGEAGAEKLRKYVSELNKNGLYNNKINAPIILKTLNENSRITENELKDIREIYGKYKGYIKIDCYAVVREYSQPKSNIMNKELIKSEKIVALFNKREELK